MSSSEILSCRFVLLIVTAGLMAPIGESAGYYGGRLGAHYRRGFGCVAAPLYCYQRGV